MVKLTEGIRSSPWVEVVEDPVVSSVGDDVLRSPELEVCSIQT